jgi:hypothetical protein
MMLQRFVDPAVVYLTTIQLANQPIPAFAEGHNSF